MKIPFSPPDITQAEIKAVEEVIKSGWITSGAVNQEFRESLARFCGSDKAFLLNSATAGLFFALKYFGVQEGDEVITTPYTYAATVNVIHHCGARAVFADLNQDDFNISAQSIASKITENTKVILSVDFAGNPVDYDDILQEIFSKKHLFKSCNERQKKLQRPLLLSDAAHSLGSFYKGYRVGTQADITVFSFHAVKNLTTAEGGGVVFNNKKGFDAEDFEFFLKTISLQGQTKSAYDKNKPGNWHYDIIMAGYSSNMPDILAAIGLSQLKRYDKMLDQRMKIAQIYNSYFKEIDEVVEPFLKDDKKISNCHLYPVLVHQDKRDSLILDLAKKEIASNVHFIPIPLHTFYKQFYSILDTPIAHEKYKREISLPIFSEMSEDQAHYVAKNFLACL